VLTRCPSCATHFRVTPEQLKARTGRVRCGECQNIFNALDSLIEEPAVMSAPMAAVAVSPAPTIEEIPGSPHPGRTASVPDNAEEAGEHPENQPDEIAVPSASARCVASGTSEPAAEALEPPVAEPGAEPLAGVEPEIADADASTTAAAEGWSSAFPEPPPPPRRWPWVIGSLVALAAIVLQALLAFRVELVVLWPQGKPALVALCEIADCEIGLPAKVGLVGIEASDLHPDSEHKGRLVLAATLKNRAPFAQQFPHLELTLTDTADQAIARKVLAPADYLPSTTPIANGMKSNADTIVAIGIDSGEIAASGYRLYLFYP
jgi:predicted Zn finger-like uncharacterized protein